MQTRAAVIVKGDGIKTWEDIAREYIECIVHRAKVTPRYADKRFASMGTSRFPVITIMRYTRALFSLLRVTANGRVRSVDNPGGNALTYLCGFNDKAATWISTTANYIMRRLESALEVINRRGM